MVKTLNKMLAIGAIGATALFGGLKDAKATTLEYVNSTNYPVAGGKRRFDWEVKNLNNQSGTYDRILEYTIASNLDGAGMYGFTNYWDYGGDQWIYTNGENSSFVKQEGGFTLGPGLTRTFSAFMDETNYVGTISVDSWGTAPTNITNKIQVDVPPVQFPKKLYMDENKIFWFSQTNNLGRKFITDRTDNLLDSSWTPKQTNTHSSTSTSYEYFYDNTPTNGFFRVRETD